MQRTAERIVKVESDQAQLRGELATVKAKAEAADQSHQEQRKAAYVGEYAAALQLDHTSAVVKAPGSRDVIEDIKAILRATNPDIVYTHNLADKHDTHIGVTIAMLDALRELSPEERPLKVYGCEVWRNLDWMCDEDKSVFDISARENVTMALMGVFDSQISGGKRYDHATAGRKKANATYFASHATDQAKMLEFAMDLTPLIANPALDPVEYACGYIERFKQDVAARIRKKAPRAN